MIYSVTVKSNDRVIDKATFPVGEWKEIAFWLDNAGYIERGFTIIVEVGEVNDFTG